MRNGTGDPMSPRRNVEYTVEYTLHSMETIQVVIDRELLNAADREAKREKRTRSALIRDALRGHLQQLAVRRREESDRKGYAAGPQSDAEGQKWEPEAAWPDE